LISIAASSDWIIEPKKTSDLESHWTRVRTGLYILGSYEGATYVNQSGNMQFDGRVNQSKENIETLT
jgi:hypothetical protein